MKMQNVKKSLDRISKNLSSKLDSREYLLKKTREVNMLCSQAIILIHKQELVNSKKKIKKAHALLNKLAKRSSEDLRKYLSNSEQELVEAYALTAAVDNKEIPSISTLKVSDEAYVLGLLDCIGELKRHVFEKIRKGNLDDALRLFDMMENLYQYLYPFAVYDKVVRETRRKLDVNRSLLEDVRAVITEESSRMDFVAFMKDKR
ncbi:MAG: RNA-binding protein [Nitrosopumilaceae archaeon]|nr:RNA-binding protein [Nitrosopumilaceae archaeon]NIU00503.1 RNA-binding protein [Nitrosopumilaceae archaeon]NIU86886.1 RNA-binding protein [Nitrosopumilaceae archaeon]NIV65566.1 RNA-binding protein [Nitrosopumilaceae archaeon]NIX61105.1 RNA-binding protein [Nitrosopumilaceae archaeon]